MQDIVIAKAFEFVKYFVDNLLIWRTGFGAEQSNQWNDSVTQVESGMCWTADCNVGINGPIITDIIKYI